MKHLFKETVKNEKIARLLIKTVAGIDVAELERVLFCGNYEDSQDKYLNVEYCIFEDEKRNLYTIGFFYHPPYGVDPIQHLNAATDCYMGLSYGYICPLFHRTIIAIVQDSVSMPQYAPCGENEFIVPDCGDGANPDVSEMFSVAWEDLNKPVSELGKAMLQLAVECEGEEFLTYADLYSNQ